MLFSRSEGREVEPPRDTLFKGFGNLYTRCFSLDPRVVRSSHLATFCLKALETFTLVTLT